MKRLFMRLSVCGVVLMTSAFATDLPLTATQMQRLQEYFPHHAETENLHHRWTGEPLVIDLPLNQEKRIIFIHPVSVDVQNALKSDELRLLNNNQSLYFTALHDFAKTRIYVTDQMTHEVIFLDVETNSQATNQTEYIDVNSIVPQTISNNNENNHSKSINEIAVNLIRFAIQQLYAPEKLMEQNSSIHRVAMHVPEFLPSLIYGDSVFIHPLMSWESQGLSITAIELKNKYALPTTIDVSKHICGQWIAASLYPRTHLKATGSLEDSTTLFLVSSASFANSVERCHA